MPSPARVRRSSRCRRRSRRRPARARPRARAARRAPTARWRPRRPAAARRSRRRRRPGRGPCRPTAARGRGPPRPRGPAARVASGDPSQATTTVSRSAGQSSARALATFAAMTSSSACAATTSATCGASAAGCGAAAAGRSSRPAAAGPARRGPAGSRPGRTRARPAGAQNATVRPFTRRACHRGAGDVGRRRPSCRGRCGRAGRGGEAAARRRVAEQPAQRPRQGGGVAGRHELGRPLAGDLGEAAHGGQHERLAERQRGEEDAGLVDLAVGQDDEVRAVEERRELGVGHEALDEAHRRRGGGPQRREVHARQPDDPELGAVDRAPGLEQDVEALVGPHEPEEQDDGQLDLRQLGRQGHRVGDVGEVGERAVGDDVHAAGSTPASATSRSRPWAEWTTTASKRRSSRRWAPAWPGRGSRGRTSCAVRTSGRPRGSSGPSTCGQVSHCTWTTSAARAARR